MPAVRWVLKPLVFIACLAPALRLAAGAFGLAGISLGANPVAAMLHACGNWTLNFVMITLCMTPLRNFLGERRWRENKSESRANGISRGILINMAKRPKPIVLTVLDGWGYRAETKGNAIALARKPNYDRLLKDFPNTLIHTSGPYVGLPEGQMGNSEVGHMNMGAGRIIHMDITRIDLMIANKEFFKQPLLLEAMERGRTRNLHLLGLLSDGGVHSHIQHLFALLKMAREHHVERVFIHCFMDGRDTPPHSGVDFIQQLQQKTREIGCGRIASLTGRYYAMDRDNRWERVERAYRAVVHGDAPVKTADPVGAVRRSYERGITDEFIDPIVITESAAPSAPRSTVSRPPRHRCRR